MRDERRGFILIISLLVLTGLTALMSVGLIRSTVELLASRRFIQTHQAFYLAEAGLDAAIKTQLQNPLSSTQLNTLLASPGPDGVTGTADDGQLLTCNPSCPSTGTYTVTIQDNDDGDGSLATDSDFRVYLIATGEAQDGSTETLRTLLSLARPPNSLFEHAVIAGNLFLSGRVTLGDLAARIKLYVNDGSCPSCTPPEDAFQTATSDKVYASQVDFKNPLGQGLDVLCPNCSNPGIFPPDASSGTPVFKTSGVSSLALPSIDLMPYYLEAKSQHNPADPCHKYHHINAPWGTDFTIDGKDCPTGIDGVIYIERAVNVTIINTLEVRGVIVHEGLAQTCGNAGVCDSYEGGIELAAKANLKIASRESVSKGMAIIGSPQLNFKNATMDIQGFVMAGGYVDSPNYLRSRLTSTGKIAGGLIGVTDWSYDWSWGWGLGSVGELQVEGPMRDSNWDGLLEPVGPVSYWPFDVELANVTLTFAPLTELPPGVVPPRSSSSSSTGQGTSILLWGTQ